MRPRRIALACVAMLGGACLNGLTGGRPDSGLDAAADTGTPSDAAPEAAGDPGILCDRQRCTTLAQVCCKPHDASPAACDPRDGGGCTPNITVNCTSNANCATLAGANDVCCTAATDDAGRFFGPYYCIDLPTCLATAGHRFVCGPLVPDCPDGSTCMMGAGTFFFCL